MSEPYLCYEDAEKIREILKNSMKNAAESQFGRMKETKSNELPEEHRCVCSALRALELLRQGSNAGVMLHDLLFVLNQIKKVSVRKIYKLDTHGVVFILHK